MAAPSLLATDALSVTGSSTHLTRILCLDDGHVGTTEPERRYVRSTFGGGFGDVGPDGFVDDFAEDTGDSGQAVATIRWDINSENVSGADEAEALMRELLTRITDHASGNPVHGAFAVWCAPVGVEGDRPEAVLRVDLYPPDGRAALCWLPTGESASEAGVTGLTGDRRVFVSSTRPDGYEMSPAARWRVTVETAMVAIHQYVSTGSRPHCVDWSLGSAAAGA
ncbi:MAG: Imm1 family immunity protein [Actinocatenispora sp.]